MQFNTVGIGISLISARITTEGMILALSLLVDDPEDSKLEKQFKLLVLNVLII